MIILICSYGNHSNRLFQNAHIESFCSGNSIPFFNATWIGMAHHYPFRYNYWLAIFYQLVYRIEKLLQIVHYLDLNDPDKNGFYRKVMLEQKERILFIGGWCFRDYEAVARNKEMLVQRYGSKSTSKKYTSICSQFSRYDVVLGVHIRRGDYKHWKNGIYYFDISVYNRIIIDFIALQKGKSVFVVYFSDDKIDTGTLTCPVDYTISNNPYYIDYKLMGRCNYLIGTLSTFTLWASFIYSVPYLHIGHPDQKFDLHDFQVHKG